MEMFVIDIPVEQPTLNIGRPTVNLTNFHSGVWGVLRVFADDEELKPEYREILAKARDALDECITPPILYEIMKDEASDYILDPYNMLVYANLINEEARELIDAE